MSTYVCESCGKDFKHKSSYNKHKKTKCISIDDIDKIDKSNKIINNNKNNLTTLLKNCLDILRDTEHITGDKALRNLTYLLDLRLLEPQFKETIDIDNFDYEFNNVEYELIDAHKNKLLSIVRFSNLAKEKEDNISTNIKFLWDDILAVHPKTKNIFLTGQGFDITKQTTFKKLINKLNSFDFESIESDILGEAYEEVIQHVMIGKTLGQFFTPSKVKQMMVKLIEPQINKNGSIEKIFDPAMGTGGFLITCLRHLIKESKDKNIKLDWDFIRTQGIGGREADSDTYQLAVSNMLISSGYMFDVLEKGDSIRDPITNKYDIVLTNPPFGITGLIYTDINHILKNEYLPIKSNSAIPLFLQAIIYQLKINGRCATVLPDGQELFSKNSALVSIREFLMKTCDLKEIIYLPSGIFEYTPIKTCIFYFIKKCEGKDVLETNIKLSKTTQKETERKYIFIKTHQTSNVQFYDYNPHEDVKNLLVEVPIEKIANNSYSLNYAEYMKDKSKEQYKKNTIIKTLGDICEFKNGVNITKEKLIIGEYPVVGGGQSPLGYHNVYNVDENTIIISKDGAYAGFVSKYNKKVFVSNHGIYISKIKEHINKDYIYYLLKIVNQQKIYDLQKGTAQPGVNKTDIEQIKIPIPSFERQQEIVKYLDFIYEKTIKTSNEKIKELKQLNEYCLNNQKTYNKNIIMKTLGDICEFKNGKGIKKDTLINGEYPVIGGGQKPMGYHNEYNTDENTILCSSSGAYAGFINKYDKKAWASDCFSIIPNNNSISNTFLYYLLKTIQDKIYNLQTGTAQPHIYSKDLQKIEIPILSLERQKEIVDYCEANDNLIKQLEKEIETNKTIAQQFITDIVKVDEEELDDTNSIILDDEKEVIEILKTKVKKVVKKEKVGLSPSPI